MNDGNRIIAEEAGTGNFAECLVEGSAEDNKRGRKTKRRAITISVALQSAGLTALWILPLLAKPPEPGIVTTTPVPPYGAFGAPPFDRALSSHGPSTVRGLPHRADCPDQSLFP
jgi:hypothetical protein